MLRRCCRLTASMSATASSSSSVDCMLKQPSFGLCQILQSSGHRPCHPSANVSPHLPVSHSATSPKHVTCCYFWCQCFWC
jgi:hypothetical protein